MLPNFLMIGAARSGTTSLHSYLSAQSDIYLPPKRPEPHFFFKAGEFSRGIDYYQSRYFSNWRGEKAVGECSTSYVFGPECPARVAKALPDVKLICVLRNPIDRAFSGYWHSVQSGLETMAFEEAIVTEQSRGAAIAGTPLGELAPFAYVARGMYHQQLSRWLERFPARQLLVVLFDDLCTAPQATIATVTRFLEIADTAAPVVDFKKENTSVPAGARMTAAMHRLLADTFREDVVALERLLGRRLTDWLEKPNPEVVSLD